jgi:phosphoglycolate phosphatase-like HAD superfamily hydrolase
MIRAVLFDVDGTLVDSNDAHARAWVDAFGEAGVTVSFQDVRRAIGMGGDKLMPRVSGLTEDSPRGAAIAARRREIFKTSYLPHLKAFRDADRLAAALGAAGRTLVAASSAKRDELRPLLQVAGVDALFDAATSSDDAEESKPDPDIVEAALRKARASAHESVMIGDTPYDMEAARGAGVPAIAFRCGGWSDDDLRGAAEIYDGPWDLLARLARSRLLAA